MTNTSFVSPKQITQRDLRVGARLVMWNKEYEDSSEAMRANIAKNTFEVVSCDHGYTILKSLSSNQRFESLTPRFFFKEKGLWLVTKADALAAIEQQANRFRETQRMEKAFAKIKRAESTDSLLQRIIRRLS